MLSKTSPASRTTSDDPRRNVEASWTPDIDRDGDDLARLGLVDDRSDPLDPREALTDLRLGDGSPDRRHKLKGLDSAWATRRIV